MMADESPPVEGTSHAQNFNPERISQQSCSPEPDEAEQAQNNGQDEQGGQGQEMLPYPKEERCGDGPLHPQQTEERKLKPHPANNNRGRALLRRRHNRSRQDPSMLCPAGDGQYFDPETSDPLGRLGLAIPAVIAQLRAEEEDRQDVGQYAIRTMQDMVSHMEELNAEMRASLHHKREQIQRIMANMSHNNGRSHS